MPPLPAAILDLAERQLGVISRRQLVAGIGDGRADALLHDGYAVRLERGVYRLRGGARLGFHAAVAAQLRAGTDTTLTGPAVLGHLGVDGFRTDDPFEVLLPVPRRLRLSAAVRLDPEPDRPVTRLGEVRLASPADALIDAARWRSVVGDRALRLGYDAMRWAGILRTERFARRLDARGGEDAGAAALLEVLEGRLVEESDGERGLGGLLARFDPPPEPQVVVVRGIRVDWFFVGPRVAVEYDGVVDHLGSVAEAEDRAREQRLAEAGVRVVRATAADLRQPAELAARLAGVLASRAVELGVTAPVLTRGLHVAG